MYHHHMYKSCMLLACKVIFFFSRLTPLLYLLLLSPASTFSHKLVSPASPIHSLSLSRSPRPPRLIMSRQKK
ncbi:hypothetical protein B0T19DRAFT_430718 [Cercophora scortea]|uniref:Uncharacterized protein n=1 Tax=Cercophora scortea TaxID=314031 RepID=A0AAE0M6Z1_9PEZI|nr:hypothetical protein B0T19DRAFT_430718 [Cercophora scortea]